MYNEDMKNRLSESFFLLVTKRGSGRLFISITTFYINCHFALVRYFLLWLNRQHFCDSPRRTTSYWAKYTVEYSDNEQLIIRVSQNSDSNNEQTQTMNSTQITNKMFVIRVRYSNNKHRAKVNEHITWITKVVIHIPYCIIAFRVKLFAFAFHVRKQFCKTCLIEQSKYHF